MREDWPIVVDELFGCWLWSGRLDKDGYGQIWRGRRPVHAHRHIYREEVGGIPDGYRLDHLCRRRACVRPDHLEAVRESENQRRKSWRYRARTMKQCKQGHDLQLSGMITPEGGKVCRLCR